MPKRQPLTPRVKIVLKNKQLEINQCANRDFIRNVVKQEIFVALRTYTQLTKSLYNRKTSTPRISLPQTS